MSVSEHSSRKSDIRQAGMISIMITMVMMIVISLIVLGFAQISRRNQRQSLDRQLSTQAFYAAETGVNDARKLVEDALAAGQPVPSKTDCGPGTGPAATFYSSLLTSANLDTANDVKYTCVTVDPTPTVLPYDLGSTSSVVPVISAGGTIANIKLVWQTKDATTTPTTNCPVSNTNAFSSTSSWTCGYGVLRFDLVPTSGSLTLNGMLAAQKTSFLIPWRVGGASTLSNSSWTNRLGVACNDTNCTLTITNLSSSQYYLRISSIYKDVTVQVSATDSASASLPLAGAQAKIDATGRAQDVLRRIQVHVPLTGSSRNQMSDYAIQSTDSVCKRFTSAIGHFDTKVTGVGGTNPLCQP